MNPGVLLAFVLIIGIPLLGVVILVALSMVRHSHQAALPRGMVWFLHLLGWGMFGGGGLVVVGLLAIQMLHITVGEFQTGDLPPAIIVLLVGVLVAAAGVVQIAIAIGLSRPLTVQNQSLLQRNLSILRILGWTFIALPLMFVGVIFIFVPILFGAAGLGIWTHHRRAQQGSLLWLLAIAVEKKMPLIEEIEAYADSLWGLRRRKTQELAERLREGIPLPQALEELPGLVPNSAVLAAYTGASSGTLAQSLRDAAVRHASSLDPSPVASSVSGFIIYCCSILVITQVIVGFQIYYIVPKLKRIFEDFSTELPAVTQALLAVSDTMSAFFLLFIPILALPSGLLLLMGVSYCLGWSNLRIPVVTRRFPRTDSPWILRILAQTVVAGRALVDGLRTLSAHHPRSHIRGRLSRTVQFVEGGEDAWHALESEGLINGREVAVITAAQRAGNLPWALNELADSMERRQTLRLLTAFELARPFVVIAIGAVVAFVCIGFFSPLIKLLNDLS